MILCVILCALVGVSGNYLKTKTQSRILLMVHTLAHFAILDGGIGFVINDAIDEQKFESNCI